MFVRPWSALLVWSTRFPLISVARCLTRVLIAISGVQPGGVKSLLARRPGGCNSPILCPAKQCLLITEQIMCPEEKGLGGSYLPTTRKPQHPKRVIVSLAVGGCPGRERPKILV